MNAIAQSSTSPASGPQLDNRRVLAGLIDLAIVVAGTVAIGVIAGIYDGDAPAVSLPVAAVMTAWALYYYFACESGGGQTLGKKVMRLRVVRVDGRPAGMGDIAVRTVVRVLDMQFVYLVGLITMLATGKRRGRLGDLAAGTMVVAADGPAPVTPAAAAVAAGPETLSRPEAMGAAAPAPVAPAPPEIRPFDPPAEPATNAPSEPVYPEEPARDLVAPSEPPPAVAEEAVAEPAVEAPEEAAVEPWAEAVVEPASPVEPAEEAAAPVDEPVLEAVVEPAFPLQDDPAEEAASPVHEPVLEAVVEPAFEVEEEELHEETAPEPLAAVDDLSLAGGPVLPMDDLSELDPYADEGELADLDALEDEPVVAPAFPVEDVLEPEPVVELHPVSVPLPAPEVEVPEAAQPDPDDGDDDEPEVVVKSVETVSAIDLVMGDDEPVRDEPEADASAESDQQ